MRSVLLFLFVILILAIFYLSWLPNHDFKGLGIMPDWLAEWADRYGNFRTSIPFFIIGTGYELYMRGKNNNWGKRLVVWCILFFVVCMSEVGQFFLPNRYPSFADVFWGNAGTISGMLTGRFINFIFTPEGE